MNEIPKRDLTDVIALYSIEPTLIDIYVEGTDDKMLLEYLLASTGAHIMEIDELDIPATAVEALGLTKGRKGEVITLAVELNRELDGQDVGVRCLVDADLDRALGIVLPESPYLMVTDFCCLESYWFGDDQLTRYRKLGLHDKGPLANADLHALLEPILRECFLLRYAAASLGLSLAWLEPMAVCTNNGRNIEFDQSEFIVRWLHKNAAHEHRELLVEAVERLRSRLDVDTRNCMHGKDFIAILSWYVRPYTGLVQLGHKEVTARLLACCLERGELLAHPVLHTLMQWALPRRAA